MTTAASAVPGSSVLGRHRAEPPRLPTLVVAVPTCRRPEEIEEILPLLREQARGVSGIETEVLVVDNDPAAGARAFVTDEAAFALLSAAVATAAIPTVRTDRREAGSLALRAMRG